MKVIQLKGKSKSPKTEINNINRFLNNKNKMLYKNKKDA